MPNNSCLPLVKLEPQFDLLMSTANCLRGYSQRCEACEAFKLLHLGMISEVKRKSLPAIALICWLKESLKLASLSRANLLGQSSSYKRSGWS